MSSVEESTAVRPGPPPCPPAHGLLSGRTAVITAAAGAGIGAATARRFLEEGARVVLGDRHARRLRVAVAELSEEFGGRQVAGLPCDVTDEEQVAALFELAEERHGALDIVVNNAGLGGTAELTAMTDDQWDAVVGTTLGGTFRCTRAALRRMRTRGTGVVVNNASVAGWRAQHGQAHYAAAKAGVMALTRCAAVEAAAYGVRVNAVAPSLALHPHLSKVTTPELLDELVRREAFGRAAEPWEVANVIVFLASGYSSYMTGETVSVSSQRA
ncbi:SDR family oxidoreductase [Streptomyces roseoverticillatus]|uniref:SDR family oxidoreductase n=1 Tax=Streptomyces roseoverticillatus TaxID=66429 RepID=UPI0033DE1B82